MITGSKTQVLTSIAHSCAKTTVRVFLVTAVLITLAYIWLTCTPAIYPTLSSWLLAAISEHARSVFMRISSGHPALLLAEFSALATTIVSWFLLCVGFKARKVSRLLCISAFSIAGSVVTGLLLPALIFMNSPRYNALLSSWNPAILVNFLVLFCVISFAILIAGTAYLIISIDF